jgi:hypothetical protein
MDKSIKEYNFQMPFRYLKQLLGREPDARGDNMKYLDCKVNAQWFFEKYKIINYDYYFWIDLDTELEEPIRYVGVNVKCKEDKNDLKIIDYYPDNYVSDVIFYTTHLIFTQEMSIEEK